MECRQRPAYASAVSEKASSDRSSAAVPLPRRGNGLSRADRAREAILEATFAVLKERGYAGASIDAIASMAGVSKTTIYANWNSKAAMVVELLGRFADDAALTPDTGDLREDLLLTMRRVVEVGSQLRGVSESIIAEAVHNPMIAEAFAGFVNDWRRHERELVRRSIDRGLIPADIDEEVATDLVAATVYFRVFLAGTGDLPERLVDPVLRAWGAQTGPRSKRRP